VPPEANFYATPFEGIGPLHVCFKNLSTCASKWFWEFGDGATSTEKHPCHIFYPEQKYYTVKLTVWGCGGEDMLIKENYIQVNKQVQVNFAATSLVGPAAGFFNNCGGSANHFKWEYGDGTVEEYTGDVRTAIDPEHRYNETVKGEYDVTLTAWGNGGCDKLTIPNMLYVDPDFLFYPLSFIEGSKTYTGEGWDCIADHNPVKGVGAVWGDAWATFALSDSCQIHYLRMLPDAYLEREFMTTIVDKFEIWLSLDGINFEKALADRSAAKHGEWEIFTLTTPMNAKFLKIKLVSARGEQTKNVMKPKHIEVVELQVFGKAYQPIVALGKNLSGANGTIPTDFALSQNFPNPFNPATSIRYELPEKAEVLLTIYNLQGQRVQTLAQGQMDAGVYDLQWNACDYNGSPVATGIYIYQFHAKGETKTLSFTRKMTFMK
jgi:PKD repeat protein